MANVGEPGPGGKLAADGALEKLTGSKLAPVPVNPVAQPSQQIAELAASCGAEVPFRRPAALANDHAGTTEVIAHATPMGVRPRLAA